MKMLVRLVVGLLIVGLAVGGPLSRKETAKPRASDVNYRLPRHIQPVSYIVRLTPDLDSATFIGSVTINIKVSEAAKNITLHNRKLDILKENVAVKDSASKSIKVKTIENGSESDQEFFIIMLEETLKSGQNYVVEISKFSGVLNDQKQGFYLADYKDKNGQLRKFATTQFEPTAARRAFPCFDEPALKAKFQMFLTRPNNTYNAVANTPRKTCKEIPGSTEVEDEFEITEKMSTYLLAFIVSDMELSSIDNHAVLARPQAIEEQTEQYALQTGIKILKAIAEFVDVAYTLPKMDQAAIPDKHFSAGAMENWGLVTYRETYLLKSDKSTTTSMHQSIATIIAHEFGHQWFGNLVSPKWWEYIWLNEGFATYFEHLGAATVEPKWRIMDQFVVKNTQYAFQPDSLTNTRAMNHQAGSPSEVSALFDRIAYEKSGSVIRMMEAFLTTAVFKKGLKYYLDAKQTDSAEPADLYQQLQRAVDENKNVKLPLKLAKIMESWDSQKGYPVVNVIRNYTATDNEKIFLNQSIFLLKNATSDDNSYWIVPLNFATQNSSNFDSTTADQWLTKKEQTITLQNLNVNDWLLVNKQQTGYYRVNYDEINWKLLTDALLANLTHVHLLNRAQLIDDSFNLARSGRLSYSIPLQLSLYLSAETDYIPFYSFFTAAKFLHTMLPGSSAYSLFKVHVLALLEEVHKHLGFEETTKDAHLDKLNRITVYNWLCNLGDSECRTTAYESFKKWKNDALSVPLNLQAPVYCGAMRIASQEDWDFLYSKYKEALNGEDGALKTRILNALGCSETIEILENFLKISIASGSAITPENAFASIYNSGSIGVTAAFDYLILHFEPLHTQLQNRMSTILSGIGSKLTTEYQLNKLKELSEKHSQQKELFKSAIASAEENVQWNAEYLWEISNWFDGKYKGAGSTLHVFSCSFIIVASYVFHYLLR